MIYRFISRFFNLEILLLFYILIFKFFFIDHYFINFDYMEPTFKYNDIVLYKKYSYGWSIWNSNILRKFGIFKKKSVIKIPNHGDLVFFFNNKNKVYIKRVIALEGESVQIINGLLYVNGEPVNKIFLKNITILKSNGEKVYGSLYLISLINGLTYRIFEDENFINSSNYNTSKFIVPKNNVFVQSDYLPDYNSSFNTDFIGPVPLLNLIGKPFSIVFGSKTELTKLNNNIILYIIKSPYRILNYIYNIDITRIWKQIH